MSEQTKATMDAAIAAHFADEGEDGQRFLTGYLLQAQGVGEVGDLTEFMRCAAAGQNATTTLGLAVFAKLHIEAWILEDD